MSSKKEEDSQEEEDKELEIYPLKKAKSMAEKDSIAKEECDPEPIVQSAKLKKKSSFKKSKSVSFRTLDED